ncbi:MAG: glycerol-3-phosphate 1-O-acyltransferase PlsY [Chloroflexi bacterium]|nr:glycerol-3-phosphate 1-O-acyltransferase PlsY [Chloroflexota bacterium]
MLWIPVIALSYLLGSLPVGVLLGKASRGIDLREYGSGKTGATNVLRTLGWKAAVLVFVADLLKGVLAVILARLLLQSKTWEIAAALSAVVGHNWSIFIGFKGGRGVTTSLGGLLTMSPFAGGIGLASGLAVIGLFKYVSLGSILGALFALISLFVLWALGQETRDYLVYTFLVTILIWVQHRDNIKRLLSGTERKLGQGANKRSGENNS